MKASPTKTNNSSLSSLVHDFFQIMDQKQTKYITKVQLMTQLLCASALDPPSQQTPITEIKSLAQSIFTDKNGKERSRLSEQQLLTFFQQMQELKGSKETTTRLQKYIQSSNFHLYFGYGSNMSLEGMVTKELQPARFVRARLENWQLIFNMHVLDSMCDPSFANVVAKPGKEVHGVAILLSSQDIQAMDKIEITYKRFPLPISLYDEDGGGICTAQVYIFTQKIAEEKKLTHFVQEKECNPSQRYLNMVLKGARQKQLDKKYIENLSRQQVIQLPTLHSGLTAEILNLIQARKYTLSEVTATRGKDPALYVLKGVVFRASGLYASILGGRDTTLFEAQRVNIVQSLADLSAPQKSWINARLAEGIAKQGSPVHQIVGMTNFEEYDW